MEKDKVVVIATFSGPLFNRSDEYIKYLLLRKVFVFGRMLLILGDYLTKYSKKFDSFRYDFAEESSRIYRNDTATGVMGLVNRSEIDIGIDKVFMNEQTTGYADFTFPYELESVTFVTRKAEYKPQIFAILQVFSLPLWIAIISTFIVISSVYHATFKGKYSLDKILLYVFAVLLRQSSVLKPSTMIKQFLVISWIVGAMSLCLAYDSVVLSFFFFPPYHSS